MDEVVRYDKNGYVICRACGKGAWDISRATRFAYAYHVKCRPWNTAEQERRQRFDEFVATKRREENESHGLHD